MGEINENSFDIIIPDVLAGKAQARTNPKERIYAQIIGTGMLDVACAGLLLQKLAESGEQVQRFDMTK
jgi:ornithine cyclodeaminase/alanine dehydrogenase-like protein (mu-crystallin family)